MSLYIVRKQDNEKRKALREIKKLCNKKLLSFSGDNIGDIAYFPKRIAWLRWRYIL